MVRRPSPEVRHSKELDERLAERGPEDRQWWWISDMDDVLKENMFAGRLIQKKQIPEYYVEKYGVNNLYWYHHPDGYRSC